MIGPAPRGSSCGIQVGGLVGCNSGVLTAVSPVVAIAVVAFATVVGNRLTISDTSSAGASEIGSSPTGFGKLGRAVGTGVVCIEVSMLVTDGAVPFTGR